MSARSLGRGYGTVITCSGSGCSARSVTGQIRVTHHRAWLKSQGWGRGSDPGSKGRAEQPARAAGLHPVSGKRVRARLARPAVEARPRTMNKDLRPPCLKADSEATAKRKEARRQQRAAARAKRDRKAV